MSSTNEVRNNAYLQQNSPLEIGELSRQIADFFQSDEQYICGTLMSYLEQLKIGTTNERFTAQVIDGGSRVQINIINRERHESHPIGTFEVTPAGHVALRRKTVVKDVSYDPLKNRSKKLSGNFAKYIGEAYTKYADFEFEGENFNASLQKYQYGWYVAINKLEENSSYMLFFDDAGNLATTKSLSASKLLSELPEQETDKCYVMVDAAIQQIRKDFPSLDRQPITAQQLLDETRRAIQVVIQKIEIAAKWLKKMTAGSKPSEEVTVAPQEPSVEPPKSPKSPKVRPVTSLADFRRKQKNPNVEQ